MKATTVERYKKWCQTAKSSDKFHWEGKGYTKTEFDALHFGGKTSTPTTPIKQKKVNIDIEEELHEDLEPTLDTGDTDID